MLNSRCKNLPDLFKQTKI